MKTVKTMLALLLCICMLAGCAAAPAADVKETAAPTPEVTAQQPQAVTENEPEQTTTDLEAEIVVIGGGASGMAAAVSAAEHGAKSVIVLEKLGFIGGNALISGGYLIYNDPKNPEMMPDSSPAYTAQVEGLMNAPTDDPDTLALQEAVREQYAEHMAKYPDKCFNSSEFFALTCAIVGLYNVGDYITPTSELYGVIKQTANVCDWFESLGIEWTRVTGIVGYPWPRYAAPKGYYCGQGYFSVLTKAIEDNSYPVQVLTSTPAQSIIMKDGRAVGVVARGSDGKELTINATKAVVIACGGYSANGEMLAQYNTQWEGLTADIGTDNCVGDTGDGVAMASEIGAKLVQLDNFMLFPLGDAKTGATESIVGPSTGLFVDVAGRRFADETGSRDDLCRAIFKLDQQKLYIISDGEGSKITDGINEYGANVETLIERGQLYRADTLEELAVQLGMDPAVFTETVAQFNSAMEAGQDELFGRTIFAPGDDVTEGPFYASPRTAVAHITRGGIGRTLDYRVVDEQDQVIPALFVVGEAGFSSQGISRAFGEGYELGKYIND